MNNDYTVTQFEQSIQSEANHGELSAEEFNLVSGGANCSYLGVQDHKLMQSYESRNYSC